jgi:type VI secretion system secreted protein Hcp
MPATMFLKFEPEIKGESAVKGYEGQIEVLDYQLGVSQEGGFSFAKGGTRVNSKLDDLTVMFRMCSASPKLMQYCATGKHLTKATLTAIKAAGDKPAKYSEIILTDVIVSSYRTGGAGDGDVPHESISLNFAKIDQEYFATDNKGVATSAGKGSWNQQTGAAS